MQSIQKGKLSCPNCHKEIAEIEILKNSSDSWPVKNWILFTCPSCDKSAHVELKNGAIGIGVLDGFPGPCLMISSMKENPLIIVTKNADGIDCFYDNDSFKFPARK